MRAATRGLPREAGIVAPAREVDGGGLYFSANDGRHGHELWQSNGARKGTGWSRTSTPVPLGASVSIIAVIVGQALLLLANDGVHGASSGAVTAAAGTSLVRTSFPVPRAACSSGDLPPLTNIAGTLYLFPGPPDPHRPRAGPNRRH